MTEHGHASPINADCFIPSLIYQLRDQVNVIVVTKRDSIINSIFVPLLCQQDGEVKSYQFVTIMAGLVSAVSVSLNEESQIYCIPPTQHL